MKKKNEKPTKTEIALWRNGYIHGYDRALHVIKVVVCETVKEMEKYLNACKKNGKQDVK